jgi:signal transduction histidine kinase
MRRNKTAVGLIAATAVLSLTGLLAVQILLLRQNFEWKRQAFRQDVMGALASIVEKLETRETLKRIWTVSFLKKGRNSVALLADDKNAPSLLVAPGDVVPKVQADGGDVLLTLSVPQRVRLIVVQPAGQADTTVLDEERPAGRSVIPVIQLAAGAGAAGPGRMGWVKLYLDDVLFNLSFAGGQVTSVLAYPTVNQDRVALIDKILEQFVVVNTVPVEQRVDRDELRAVVDETMGERGLPADSAYGVIPAGRPEVLLASDDGRRADILRSEFKTRMFPHDVTVAAGDLAVYFPGQEGGWITRLGAPAIVAFVFILVAAAGVFLILRAARGQKRFAAATADFVNNMTHEFKTPISTISLACDTLGQAPIRNDPDRQDKYRAMILSECLRMQDQIRKILETAALEKGDLDLRISRMDAHEEIRQAAEAFALIVEGRKGSITTRFEAPDAVIEADPVHFRNIIHNLLDNAVQYCRRPPEIVIATRAVGDRLRISVTDNGIGLSSEHQKHVFEKYFRVPTGNVHDVKGFGLGLSYVKLIVKAHRGSVDVRSEEGRGSTFEIELPFRSDVR